MIKYYVDADHPGATPDALFKAIFEEDGVISAEFVWSGKMNDWKTTNAIHRWMLRGDPRIYPIHEDEARTLLPPHAFNAEGHV